MPRLLLFLTLTAATAAAAADEPGFALRLGDNWRVTPYVAPGYTPEMGALLAAGGLFSFASDPVDTACRRSNFPVAVAYSTTGAITCSAVLASYWDGDRVRVPVDLWFKSMPDNYYGAGYDAARNTVESDSTTAYHRTWAWFNPRFLVRVKGPLYAGLDWDVNYTLAAEVNPVMAADPAYAATGAENFNNGVGAILLYDSRDVPVNAWTGAYFSGRARFYGKALGGDNDYQIYDFDYRYYLPVGGPGRTLAWQFRTRIGKGGVPWAEMSQPGTPFDLRGYRWGRYRDNAMLYMLAEYRHMLRRDDGQTGPHGLVGWVGGGSIAPEARDFRDWLPNFGVGYRLQVQPRMNLRLDVGFGKEEGGWEPALYFNFNEAF